MLCNAAGMALDTQDVADYARSHTKGLRLTFWLFKTDQVPHNCTCNLSFAQRQRNCLQLTMQPCLLQMSLRC